MMALIHFRKFLSVFSSAILCLFFVPSSAQQLRISDFVLFAGNGSVAGSQSPVPSGPGYAVQLSSSTTINGGRIGSAVLVKTTGNSAITGSIHSKGRVELANSNLVTGSISAENNGIQSGNSVVIGSSLSLAGNIDANGNITIGGGTISGYVQHPQGTSYTGPQPGGGEIIGPPALPSIPALPGPANLSPAGNANISGTQSITPGAYGQIALTGNKTLTFSGPGNYYFQSINNTGNSNTFRYDFLNSAAGTIRIYVHGNINLGKFTNTLVNGGNPSRIFIETHGAGPVAFSISNGSGGSGSRLSGNIYAPYAAISMGSGTGSTQVTGSMWSGTQIIINSGVSITYASPFQCTLPMVNAGTDTSISCIRPQVQLSGSSSIQGVSYSWTGPGILAGGQTVTPLVNSPGTYTLTVDNNGCTASDQVVVNADIASPGANAGSDGLLSCLADSIALYGSSPTTGVLFNWTGPGLPGGANNSSVFVDQTGTYTLTVTNPVNGCSSTDQAVVSSNFSTPQANAGSSNALTCTILELILNGSGGGGSAIYSWTTSALGNIVSGESTAQPLINATGTYYLTVTDTVSGCSTSDSVVITEGPCILPYYTPCPGGKYYGVLGCELSSLFINYSVGSDTINDVYFFSGDSVYVEIISQEGQTQDLFNLIYDNYQFCGSILAAHKLCTQL